MDSVDIEVLRSAEAWRKAGHRVTFGTIVRTWGSAPRPVGALVVIRDDGQVVGSVSGGCVEDDLIEKVRAGGVAKDKPQLITYGVTNEEATRCCCARRWRTWSTTRLSTRSRGDASP